MLAVRDRINRHLQEIIDLPTGPWGIGLGRVEVTAPSVKLRSSGFNAMIKGQRA